MLDVIFAMKTTNETSTFILCLRLAFNQDGSFGAFMTSPRSVILFKISEFDGKLDTETFRKRIESQREVNNLNVDWLTG